MASIHEQIDIAASAATVWAAARDYGALPDMVPGFVAATEVEDGRPPVRVVTFASGIVMREVIVDVDDTRRRLVWTIESPDVRHHNGVLEVVDTGNGCTVRWTADVLPDALVAQFQPGMSRGLAAMKRRFDG